MPVEVIDYIKYDELRYSGGPFSPSGSTMQTWREEENVALAPYRYQGLTGPHHDSRFEADDVYLTGDIGSGGVDQSLKDWDDSAQNLLGLEANCKDIYQQSHKVFVVDQEPVAMMGELAKHTNNGVNYDTVKWILRHFEMTTRTVRNHLKWHYGQPNPLVTCWGIPVIGTMTGNYPWIEPGRSYMKRFLNTMDVVNVTCYPGRTFDVSPEKMAQFILEIRELADSDVPLVANFVTRKTNVGATTYLPNPPGYPISPPSYPVDARGDLFTDDELYPYITATLGTGECTYATYWDNVEWARPTTDPKFKSQYAHMAMDPTELSDEYVRLYTLLKNVADYSASPN